VRNVDDGYSQLVKYFEGLKTNRMLILKIFSVLIIFIVFFLVAVA